MKLIFLAINCMLLTFLSTKANAADPVIEVYGIHAGSAMKYRYRVVNKTNVPISGLMLGINRDTGEALFPRSDWLLDADQPDPIPPADPNRCKPFPGMICYANIITDSQYQNAYVEIRSTDESSSGSSPAAGDIASGQTSDWMELLAQRPHKNYLSGKSVVYFRSEYEIQRSQQASLKTILLPLNFVNIDTTLPSISGSISRTIANGIVTAKAILTVSDNLDPNPRVRLVNITSNQNLASGDVQATLNADTRTVKLKQEVGRTYTLNYTVTDGSNNTKALALTVQGS
jgi:hypothetical protein